MWGDAGAAQVSVNLYLWTSVNREPASKQLDDKPGTVLLDKPPG